MRFVGLCEDEPPVSGVAAVSKTHQKELKSLGDWSAVKAFWQQRIEQLAKDFRNGEAGVDPISARACSQCDYHPLCRIDDREGADVLMIDSEIPS